MGCISTCWQLCRHRTAGAHLDFQVMVIPNPPSPLSKRGWGEKPTQIPKTFSTSLMSHLCRPEPEASDLLNSRVMTCFLGTIYTLGH